MRAGSGYYGAAGGQPGTFVGGPKGVRGLG